MNTLRLLKHPIAEWPAAILAQRASLQEIESELAALIQQATLLHGYVSHRYNTGCGEQSHTISAKKANRDLVMVRKALGYAYPKNTPIQIQP